jgi:hypothetical protein
MACRLINNNNISNKMNKTKTNKVSLAKLTNEENENPNKNSIATKAKA